MSKSGAENQIELKQPVYTPFGYGYIEVAVSPTHLKKEPQSKEENERKDGGEEKKEQKVEEKCKEDKTTESVLEPKAEDRQIIEPIKEEIKVPHNAQESSSETTREIAQLEKSKGEEELQLVYLRSGASVNLQRKLVKSEVTLKFKMFHGAREVYTLTVPITDTIGKVKSRLIEIDKDKELAECKQIRLVYPIGKIKELSSSYTIDHLELPDEALIVVIGQKTFTWSPTLKGSDIELLNGNTTAKKKQIQDYETVLGAVSFSTGRHYWEIKLEALIDPEDIIIGITVENVNLMLRPTDGEGQLYWGYICCAGKIFSPKDDQLVDYGGICIKNDTVGVLLEFDKDRALLTFYRNKKNLGVAFSEIPCGTYYPAVTLFYSGVKVSLNTSVPVPVENPLSQSNLNN